MKKILFGMAATLLATSSVPVVAETSSGTNTNVSNTTGLVNTSQQGYRGSGIVSIPGISQFNSEVSGQAESLQRNLSTARNAVNQLPAPVSETPIETIVVQPDPAYVEPLSTVRKKPVRAIKKPVRGRG